MKLKGVKNDARITSTLSLTHNKYDTINLTKKLNKIKQKKL